MMVTGVASASPAARRCWTASRTATTTGAHSFISLTQRGVRSVPCLVMRVHTPGLNRAFHRARTATHSSVSCG